MKFKLNQAFPFFNCDLQPNKLNISLEWPVVRRLHEQSQLTTEKVCVVGGLGINVVVNVYQSKLRNTFMQLFFSSSICWDKRRKVVVKNGQPKQKFEWRNKYS
jgi:hypothetical protein